MKILDGMHVFSNITGECFTEETCDYLYDVYSEFTGDNYFILMLINKEFIF